MLKHYRNYYWEDALPKGLSPVDLNEDPQAISYKIISDPYHKWISIEKYLGKAFQKVVYDTALFDFRCLKPEKHIAWQKTPSGESEDGSLIRNQDDRIVLFELYSFVGNRCSKCFASTPHGFPVSTQRIYWKALGDLVDGVALFDQEGRPVMYKLYKTDPETGEFSELIEEKWKMQHEDPSKWQKSPS